MLDEQKAQIAEMRSQKCSYTAIANRLSLSVNTVKSYCRRNGIDTKAKVDTAVCKQCGQPITVKEKCKPRQFCSDKCRSAWWFARHESTKTEYHLTCACCGNPFVSIGNKARKYCCHECYIADRFGKKVGRDG